MAEPPPVPNFGPRPTCTGEPRGPLGRGYPRPQRCANCPAATAFNDRIDEYHDALSAWRDGVDDRAPLHILEAVDERRRAAPDAVFCWAEI